MHEENKHTVHKAASADETEETYKDIPTIRGKYARKMCCHVSISCDLLFSIELASCSCRFE